MESVIKWQPGTPMKLWIARDLGGMLSLHYKRPTYIANRGWDKVWAIPDSSIFPEVTFENSPQEVELKLIENETRT